MIAKIHQALRPNVAELFFSNVSILVEGLEDAAYITTHLHITKRWDSFRRSGCHLVIANGKSNLIQPLAIARQLRLPVFVIFDADGDKTKDDERRKHEKDNRALKTLLEADFDLFPNDDVIGSDHAVWKANLGTTVGLGFDDLVRKKHIEKARVHYDHEKDLEKHELFIADWLSSAYDEGHRSAQLDNLCEAILTFARC
jgi:predicted ATP-dependent endonuclease of OLD family